MERLAETGKTDHPILEAYFSAQYINLLSGGAVVKPWEIRDDPEFYQDWIDAALVLKDMTNILRRKQIRQQAIAAEFEKMRNAHTVYNSYRH